MGSTSSVNFYKVYKFVSVHELRQLKWPTLDTSNCIVPLCRNFHTDWLDNVHIHRASIPTYVDNFDSLYNLFILLRKVDQDEYKVGLSRKDYDSLLKMQIVGKSK